MHSPAGHYLVSQGIQPENFNTYGARRGNHEVMVRGTFASIRLHNQLAPGTDGGWTTHQPSGEQMSIFDASQRYRSDGYARKRRTRPLDRLTLVVSFCMI